MMTHYCGAGNQPRMKGRSRLMARRLCSSLSMPPISRARMPDTCTARFSHVDATHHSEDWTYLSNGKEETHRFELHRVATASAAPPE